MFIFGQIVKANILLFYIQERGDARIKLQDELVDLQNVEDLAAERRGRLFEVRSALEVIDNEIENLLHTWVNRYERAAQSMALLHDDPQGSHAATIRLLASTDGAELFRSRDQSETSTKTASGTNDQNDAEPAVSVKLTETHRLDLLEFVTQACEVIPGIDVVSACLRKSKLLDMMLAREGKSPLFFKLSDDNALVAGNQLTKFLASLVDQQGVSKLLAGEVSLAELGLTETFAEALESVRAAIGASVTREARLTDAGTNTSSVPHVGSEDVSSTPPQEQLVRQ